MSSGGVARGHFPQNSNNWYEDIIVASAARTETGNSGDLTGFGPFSSFTFHLDVTAAATDAGDTLNVVIERKLPVGTYQQVAAFTEVIGTDSAEGQTIDIFPGGDASTDEYQLIDAVGAGNVQHLNMAETIRISWTIVDAGTDNASFTFSVGVMAKV